MSLLTVVQSVSRRLTLPVPTAVATSSDVNVQLMFELANEDGQELQKRCQWQILMKEDVFPAVTEAVQPGFLPADFDRFIGNSQYDRSTRRQMLGPITPQVWQSIQAQPQLNRVFLAFRQRGGEVLITPNPAQNDQIAYEYISINWVQSQNGQGQAAYAADTDVSLLDENLIKLGVRWRFKKEKGFDYAEDFTSYERMVQISMGNDGGKGALDFTGGSTWPIPLANLPEGNFPGG
jgi:hypothetical protein